MSSITLYHFDVSGPSRGALLAARLIEAPITIKNLNLFNKEHLQESFLKINPQHCVPTLDDCGFVVWDSHAIACYLADKYGKDDKYYPKDLKQRAIVNQRLHFDSSSLYVNIRAICFPILFLGETEIKEPLKNNLNSSLEFVEMYLKNSKWIAGDHLTIADTSIHSSISSILAVGWDVTKFNNIQRWLEQCKQLPGYEENQSGAKKFGEAVRKNLK